MRGLVDVALSGAPVEIIPLLQLVCRIADRSPAAAELVRAAGKGLGFGALLAALLCSWRLLAASD